MTRETVSPRTSARYSASSTSLSRSGRIMATMSFMGPPASTRHGLRGKCGGWGAGRRHFRHDQDRTFAAGVGLLAVLAHIHAYAFGARFGAEGRDQTEDLEDDEGHETGI